MREVLKWNENHITGKRTELKCLKPENGLIGKAKIELYRDGNVIDETYTENIITNWCDEGIHLRTEYGIVAENDRLFPYIIKGNRFGTIFLTDIMLEESVDNKFLFGDTIGYCPKTNGNTGSDVKRGAYNAVESYSEITEDRYYHEHLVYDFGTSQANGVIDSIVWTVASSKSGTLIPMSIGLVSLLHPKLTGIDANLVNDYKNDLYKKVEDLYYKVINIPKYFNGLEPLKLEETPTEYVGALEVMNNEQNYIKYVSTSASYKNAATLDLKYYDMTTNSIIKTVRFSTLEMFPELYGQITTNSYDNGFSLEVKGVYENGDLIIYLYMNTPRNELPNHDEEGNFISQTGTRFVKIHGIYNIINETWVQPLDYKDKNSVKMENVPVLGEKFIRDENYLFQYLSSHQYRPIFSIVNRKSSNDRYVRNFDLEEMGVTYSDVGEYFNYLYYVKELDIVIGRSNPGVRMYKRIPYTAHTKLPNPVVKTASDTMKIQYDYFIQIPHTFPINGSYLPEPKPVGE